MQGGNNCKTGEMIMYNTPATNPVPDVGRSNEVFSNLAESDGFWVGKSTRSCGRWDLPNPTAVFMISDDKKDILGPYDVNLPKSNRYMIFTNDEFTCVYKDVPRPSPRPVSNNSADGETYSALEDHKEKDTIGVKVTVLPGTPEPEDSAEAEDDGSTCFPGDATVELEDGSIKTMSTLNIGDKVRVGPKTFSDVFMFTHKLSGGEFEFVKISAGSSQVTLTKGHYLYVNGKLAAAKTVKVGDHVELYNGEAITVSAISCVKGTGLYNPQTVNGNIVVNNIRASTYTTTVEPMLAHKLLVPFRALYNALGLSTSVFNAGADNMAKLVPSGVSSL